MEMCRMIKVFNEAKKWLDAQVQYYELKLKKGKKNPMIQHRISSFNDDRFLKSGFLTNFRYC